MNCKHISLSICRKTPVHGSKYCEEHSNLKCAYCGDEATRTLADGQFCSYFCDIHWTRYPDEADLIEYKKSKEKGDECLK